MVRNVKKKPLWIRRVHRLITNHGSRRKRRLLEHQISTNPPTSSVELMEFDSNLPMSIQIDSCLKLAKNVWLNNSNGKNFVFSPFSIYAALGLLATGSNGRTLKQMLRFLKCNNLSHLKLVSSLLINSLDQTGVGNSGGAGKGPKGPKLTFISGLWIQSSDCTLKPSFEELSSSIYRAKAEAVDFKTKAKEVLGEINKWVQKETKGLICNILPQGSINEHTRVVLANALHFKGTWTEGQFDPSSTKNSKFYLLDGNSVQVPFMTSNLRRQYVSCYNGFKVLQLPYEQEATNNKFDGLQRNLSMYIFLPDERDGLSDLIEKVNSDSGFLERHLPINQTGVLIGDFWVPKFKISFGFEASTILKELGLVLPFDPTQAELTEMLSSSNAETNRLYVSDVIHKCFVEVEEKGTKAAASTATMMWCGSIYIPPPSPPSNDFVADHPFMFMVRDNHSGAVWFMGHVLNPLLT